MPILKGQFVCNNINNDNLICKGLWSMTHNNNDFVGQTADFEYILNSDNFNNVSNNNDNFINIIKTNNDDTLNIPVHGNYNGYFSLHSIDNGIIKINENDIIINIDKNTNIITGNGKNQYGDFIINGTLILDGSFILFKEYKAIEKQTRKRIISNVIDTTLSSPREIPLRIRKPSSLLKYYEEEVPIINKTNLIEKKISNHNDFKKKNNDDSIIMKNCFNLLKDIMKHPSAIYFLEPVNYIKLGIPDYPIFIKHPMDFSTILKKFKKYENPNNFASDVRLIIKNALKYNDKPEHFIHIAAKEISEYFENLFRPILAKYILEFNDNDVLNSKSNQISSFQQNVTLNNRNNNNELGPRQDHLDFSQNIDDNLNIIRKMRSKLDKFESKSNFLHVPIHLDDDVFVEEDIMNKTLAFDNYSKKILINLLMDDGLKCQKIDSLNIDNKNQNLIHSIYTNADNYSKKLLIFCFN